VPPTLLRPLLGASLAGCLTTLPAQAVLIDSFIGLDGPERFIGQTLHVFPTGPSAARMTTLNWDVNITESAGTCAFGSSEIQVSFSHLIGPHAGDIQPNGPFTFSLGCRTPGVHFGFFPPQLYPHPGEHSDKLIVRYVALLAGSSAVQVTLEHLRTPVPEASTWTLTGIGIAAVAAWARRRKQPAMR
jgi:hypothetical protein